jgi:hypothetical protein
MLRLIELYEMASLNDAALSGSERKAVLKARHALRMFERAMHEFKMGSIEPLPAEEASLRIAA